MATEKTTTKKTLRINSLSVLGEIAHSSSQRLPDITKGKFLIQSFLLEPTSKNPHPTLFSQVQENCGDPYLVLSQEIDGQVVSSRISKYPWDFTCNIAKTAWRDLESDRKAYKPFIRG